MTPARDLEPGDLVVLEGGGADPPGPYVVVGHRGNAWNGQSAVIMLPSGAVFTVHYARLLRRAGPRDRRVRGRGGPPSRGPKGARGP